MTARREHSRGAAKGGASAGGRSGGSGAEQEIGWGLNAEGERGEIFLRRVLFSVAVAVVGCMGAWFLLTTVTWPGDEPRSLSMVESATGSFFTARLLEFRHSESKQAAVAALTSKAAIRAAAGDSEFHLYRLPGGRVALCVGRAESRDAPELQRLCREFQACSEAGRRLFADVAVIEFPQ